MINMRPYVPSNRIAIRDSIDEDISDDVDDEVFIKDSKTSKVFSLAKRYKKKLNYPLTPSIADERGKGPETPADGTAT